MNKCCEHCEKRNEEFCLVTNEPVHWAGICSKWSPNEEYKEYQRKEIKPEWLRINKIHELKQYQRKKPQIPIVLKGDKGYITSNDWCLNAIGELIFDIPNNKYVMPFYYENGTSKIEDIYVVLEERKIPNQAM